LRWFILYSCKITEIHLFCYSFYPISQFKNNLAATFFNPIRKNKCLYEFSCQARFPEKFYGVFMFSSILKKNSGAKKNGGQKKNGQPVEEPDQLIRLRNVVKTYQSAAGGYTALKGIDLNINAGEFVGIIGKSGSGKSTLINMIAGIDRPTSGEVMVGSTEVHRLSENGMARWRGRNLGIVFQFFQLLPTLSVIENVMLPMDFCKTYPLRERKRRALWLLEMVEMSEHAYKLPSAISGGQQQRVAIARALANDPPVVIADEPTGNLDSKTADSVFLLFETLVSEGKTIVMVTHDSSLARRVSRTIIIADGEVVNEYVVRSLPVLTPQQMLDASRKVQPVHYEPGMTIIHQGEPGDRFYIITSGVAEVALKREGASDVIAAHMTPGQFFGEMSLFENTRTAATVRASKDTPVEVLAMGRETFQQLVDESPSFKETIRTVVENRRAHNQATIDQSNQQEGTQK
jgi:ABC-type lipoprotein export system ATPase subunit